MASVVASTAAAALAAPPAVWSGSESTTIIHESRLLAEFQAIYRPDATSWPSVNITWPMALLVQGYTPSVRAELEEAGICSVRKVLFERIAPLRAWYETDGSTAFQPLDGSAILFPDVGTVIRLLAYVVEDPSVQWTVVADDMGGEPDDRISEALGHHRTLYKSVLDYMKRTAVARGEPIDWPCGSGWMRKLTLQLHRIRLVWPRPRDRCSTDPPGIEPVNEMVVSPTLAEIFTESYFLPLVSFRFWNHWVYFMLSGVSSAVIQAGTLHPAKEDGKGAALPVSGTPASSSGKAADLLVLSGGGTGAGSKIVGVGAGAETVVPNHDVWTICRMHEDITRMAHRNDTYPGSLANASSGGESAHSS
jgi:hypothetical protein